MITETEFRSLWEVAYNTIPDCRDYDATLFGMMKAFESVGIKRTPLQIANMWHDPLAGIHKTEYSLQGILQAMEWRTGFELVWESRYAYTPHLPVYEDEWIEQLAEALFETEIRIQYKGTRKNSEKWNKLYVKYIDKCVEIETKKIIPEVENFIKRANEQIKETESKINRVLGHILKCQDIEILSGRRTEKTIATRESISLYVKAAQEHINYLEKRIKECRIFLDKNR